MPYTPRWYQDEAVMSIFHYYASGKDGHPVVAMPTATGKSLVIAEFIKYTLERWPRQRFMCLTHVKELIVQNAEKIRSQWPRVPLGIYSAGLSQRDVAFPVIYGGVASVYEKIELFGHRDLLLIDECHLVGDKDEGMYLKVIAKLREVNPKLKVIGFTATPYRSGMGSLTNGKIFTDICYDLCSIEAFNRLIREGYLSMLIPKATKTEFDLSNLHVRAGEFVQEEAEKAFDLDPLTWAACNETVQQGFNRRAWVAFASGIKHAENVADCLRSLGVDAAPIHSKLPMQLQDRRIADYRAGKIQCLVNYGKLTTGFDYPAIDLISMLRATMSVVLWVQMLGRGMRPSIDTGKVNCLVLDFAKNTPRLGPVNDPVLPQKRVKGMVPGVAPVRICEVCGAYNHARAAFCMLCGTVFEIAPKLAHTAGTHELIREHPDDVKTETLDVQRVVYGSHQRTGLVPTMMVSYYCGLRLIREFVSFEHRGFPKHMAFKWWLDRSTSKAMPVTVDEALRNASTLRAPRRITVSYEKSTKYPTIVGCEY
jgi:DNA repair protein RadD